MWQEYRTEKDKIQAPEAWKQEILQKMNEIDDQQRENAIKTAITKALIYIALAILAIVIVLYLKSTPTPPSQCTIIRTEQASTVVDDAYIQDLTFAVRGGTLITIRPPETNQWQREEIDLTLEQLTFANITLTNTTTHTDAPARTTYLFTNDSQQASITISTEDSRLQENSLLEYQPIGLYTIDQTYIAVFEQNGYFFQVVITDTNEQEIIQHLREIITFIDG